MYSARKPLSDSRQLLAVSMNLRSYITIPNPPSTMFSFQQPAWPVRKPDAVVSLSNFLSGRFIPPLGIFSTNRYNHLFERGAKVHYHYFLVRVFLVFSPDMFPSMLFALFVCYTTLTAVFGSLDRPGNLGPCRHMAPYHYIPFSNLCKLPPTQVCSPISSCLRPHRLLEN